MEAGCQPGPTNFLFYFTADKCRNNELQKDMQHAAKNIFTQVLLDLKNGYNHMEPVFSNMFPVCLPDSHTHTHTKRTK